MNPGNHVLAAVRFVITGDFALWGYHRPMTWRTRRMMRRSKPRVAESEILGTAVSILWSAVGLVAIILVAIGLFLYLPGTNGIENPVVTVP